MTVDVAQEKYTTFNEFVRDFALIPYNAQVFNIPESGAFQDALVIKEQLEKATPRDRVALYAVNGLWFDALTVAAQLRRRNPNNPSWAELLQVIGLNELAIEPIVECCTPR